MEYLFIGLALGSVIAYFVFVRFNKSKRQQSAQQQSVVLMEKIRNVCKFITVEGDFSEIYHYQNVKDKWMNLFLGSKKALVLIDAKAYVGFDLTKIKMHPDIKNRTIILTDFPQPELLSIETDFKYYDKKEGWANPFTSTDLTEINREAKQHIVDKVPQSGLFAQASKQSLSTVSLMENLVQTIGWKLDYKALEKAAEIPKIKESNETKPL